MACTFCRCKEFWRYLEEIDPQHEAWTEDGAKEFILAICEIESRSELDHSKHAAQRFHALVRRPFMAWKALKQGGQS